MAYLLAAVLGLVFGSFISLLTHRLPQVYQESPLKQWQAISLGRSKCPSCKAPLPPAQLIPVLSWILNRGKCHKCNKSISWRYPTLELISATLVILAVNHFGFNLTSLLASFFLLTLLTISVIDLENYLILDSLSFPLIISGLILSVSGIFTNLTDALLGATLGYLTLALIAWLFKRATGKIGMGQGDFKLFAALGAWLGLSSLPQILLISAGTALIISVVFIILGKQKWTAKIAFAPYLSFGGMITLFAGSDFIVIQMSKLI